MVVHYPLALKAGIQRDVIDAIADGRRPETMSDDERIVYDFLTELNRTKRVSIPRSNAPIGASAEGRRGSDRDQRLLRVARDAAERRALPIPKDGKSLTDSRNRSLPRALPPTISRSVGSRSRALGKCLDNGHADRLRRPPLRDAAGPCVSGRPHHGPVPLPPERYPAQSLASAILTRFNPGKSIKPCLETATSRG